MTIEVWILLLVAGYAACIWWAVAGESPRIVLAIVALMLVAFGLRIIFPHAYPWGFHEDELSTVTFAFKKFCAAQPMGLLPSGLPSLLYTITIGPLYPIVGLWWAARGYSILAFTFALPIAFGISRLLGLSRAAALGVVLPSLAALPWALLYGRSAVGAEVVLNGLVVIFTLLLILKGELSIIQLVFAGLLLAFGLFLCCLGYIPGKIELASTAVAIAFAVAGKRWSRAVVLGLALMIAVWAYDMIAVGDYVWYGFDWRTLPSHVQPAARLASAFDAVRAFWSPLGLKTSQSSSFVQMLPTPYLIALCIGLLAALRQREGSLLILWLGLGMLPGALGPDMVSAHRLLSGSMLVPFVAAFAADLLPAAVRPRVGALAAIAIIAWGASTYFTFENWTYQDQMANCSFDCILHPADTLSGRPLVFGKGPLVPLTCSDIAW